MISKNAWLMYIMFLVDLQSALRIHNIFFHWLLFFLFLGWSPYLIFFHKKSFRGKMVVFLVGSMQATQLQKRSRGGGYIAFGKNGLRGQVAREVFTFISGLANKLANMKSFFPTFRIIMQRWYSMQRLADRKGRGVIHLNYYIWTET